MKTIRGFFGGCLCILIASLSVFAAGQAELQSAFEMAAQQGGWKLAVDPIYGDFNQDGLLDMAAIVKMSSQTARLWVGTLMTDQFVLLLDADGYSGGDHTKLEKVTSAGLVPGPICDLIKYVEQTPLSDVANSQSYSRYIMHTLGLFQVVAEGYETDVCSVNEDGYQLQEFVNLSLGKGYYGYRGIAAAGQEIPSQIDTTYYCLIAEPITGVTIDGLMEDVWSTGKWIEIQTARDVTYGKSQWTGAADASYRVQTRRMGSSLLVFVHVIDEQVVWREDAHLGQDHLEIWLKDGSLFTADLRSDLSKLKRTGLYQLALYPHQAMQYLPQTTPFLPVEYQFHRTPQGYDVEIALPLGTFLSRSLNEYTEIGFTIVLSDTDTSDKQETLLATSSHKWGDAFTLGKLFLRQERLFLKPSDF